MKKVLFLGVLLLLLVMRKSEEIYEEDEWKDVIVKSSDLNN